VIFKYIYEHALVNPLLLYVFCGVVLVLFVGRRDKIVSLTQYVNVMRTRMSKENNMYEHRIRESTSEMKQMKKKVENMQTVIKKLKKS